MRQLQRDPFARMSLMKDTGHQFPPVGICKWCGKAAKYWYRWEPDAGRPGTWQGPFCSVGCYRAHEGGNA